ncbi:MAG: ATP-binding protein [Planctomycetota bacterium]
MERQRINRFKQIFQDQAAYPTSVLKMTIIDPDIPNLSVRRRINSLATVLVTIFLIGIGLLVWEPLKVWLEGEDKRDQNILDQWINHSRIGQISLGALVGNFIKAADTSFSPNTEIERIKLHRREIFDFLQELGTPVSITETAYIPLFPMVYRMVLEFPSNQNLDPVVWDSGLPRNQSAIKSHVVQLPRDCKVLINYQLRAYQDRIEIENEIYRRRTTFGLALTCLTGIGLSWIGLIGWRIDLERKAKRKAREIAIMAKSHELKTELDRQTEFLASLNVVAGSYAHNLQNLLLPPASIVDQCLESSQLTESVTDKLKEVKRLLEKASDRVRQTLKALRRDPTPGTHSLVNLNQLVERTIETWKEMAMSKWLIKLNASTICTSWIHGQESHLEQSIENLILNARDAIFEKRNDLVTKAQEFSEQKSIEGRKQAVMAAMRWEGEVIVAVTISDENNSVILTVCDNGKGMNADTLERCRTAGFSTKKKKAIHQAENSGIGLGLTFVQEMTRRHMAIMDIQSSQEMGTQIAITFPKVTV